MLNRLQFLHKDRIFTDKEDALDYLNSSDVQSLYGEPLIMRYGNKENPSVLLIIGSDGNGEDNQKKFFVIDNAETIKKIAELDEELKKAIKSYNIITKGSNALSLTVDVTEEGTVINGDVNVAKYDVVDGEIDPTKRSIIKVNEDGIFAYVDLDFDKENGKFIFKVNDKEKAFEMKEEDYVERAEYDTKTETLNLIRKSGAVVPCSMKPLLNEWTTEGEASRTPIVLTKERVDYDPDTDQYRDVLRGDIRIADDIKYNILKKDKHGLCLYVIGTADNIMYNETTTVKKAIENCGTKISADDANILYNKIDGVYANVGLSYDSTTNKLTFSRSNVNGTIEYKEIALAGVELLDHIDYHPSTKTLEIYYKDNTGTLQKVDINMADLLAGIDWVPQNDGHNVNIVKIEKPNSSNQQVSADVRISELSDNILTEIAHHLYVKGTADNIAYDKDITVKDAIDNINIALEGQGDAIEAINDALNAYGIRITKNEGDIVTLNGKLDDLSNALNAEIVRAEAKEYELFKLIEKNIIDITTNSEAIKDLTEKVNNNATSIDDINTKIGGNFSAHDTVADAIENNTALVTAETTRATAKENELEDAIANANEAIATNAADIKVLFDETRISTIDSTTVELTDTLKNGHNLKANVILSKKENNILGTETDGLYATVALDYNELTNTLTFSTGENNKKVIPLLSNSLVKRIYYDPILESIVFVYVIDGVEHTTAISVREILDEWDAKSTDTVKLTKTINSSTQGEPAKDILTADVLICPKSVHPDNILVKDNGLYVSGQQIEDNKEAIAGLQNEISEVKTSINNIGGSVDDLSSALEKEISDRKTADNEIYTKINTVISSIDQEKVDRETGDANLLEKINDEKIARLELEANVKNAITEAITNEATARENADNTIANSLNKEIADRKEADSNILSTVSEMVSSEAQVRETNDNYINNAIDKEIADRKEADEHLSAEIAKEVADRKEAIKTVNESLEKLVNADKELSDDILEVNAKLIQEVSDRKDAIADAIEKCTYTVNDTPTVDMNMADKEISANVKVANSPANIITTSSNDLNGVGIFASADLSYDSASNTLTFNTTNTTKTIQLSAGSIIDDMYLQVEDGAKYIVIKYRTTGSETQNEVRINVADLLRDIVAKNESNSPVIINVVTEDGQTAISAKILLSEAHDDNALIIDGTNGLYVSGKDIKSKYFDPEITIINQKLKDYEEEINNIENASGLNDDGTYNPEATKYTHYISGSTSLINSDIILDGKLFELALRIGAVEEGVDSPVFGGVGKYIQSVQHIGNSLSATVEDFDVEITPNSDYDHAPSSKAVYNFVTATTTTAINEKIDSLDVETISGESCFIDAVNETDGLVSARTKAFDAEVTNSGSSAPTTIAVYNFVTATTENAINENNHTLSAGPFGGEGLYVEKIVEIDGIISAITAPTDNIKTDLSSLRFSGITGDYVANVTQENGIVSATGETFDNLISDEHHPLSGAPTPNAVYEYVNDKLSAFSGGGEHEYLVSAYLNESGLTVDGHDFDKEISDEHHPDSGAPTPNAVYEYVSSAITTNNQSLSATQIGDDTTYIKWVAENDGIISAEIGQITTAITNSSSSALTTEEAVYNFGTSISGVVSGDNTSSAVYVTDVTLKDRELSGKVNSASTQVNENSTDQEIPTSKAVYGLFSGLTREVRVNNKAGERKPGGIQEITISGTDINLGDIITSGDSTFLESDTTITEAFQSLTDQLIADEFAISKALFKLNESSGFDEHGNYTPDQDLSLIAASSSVTQSIDILAEELEKNILWQVNDDNQLEPIDDRDVTARAFYEKSDINLKDNIATINDSDIAKVANVNLKEFTFKSDESNTKKYGVIAQEVENAGLENLVATLSDGTKAVDYISLLILKVQQLEKEIEELKNK